MQSSLNIIDIDVLNRLCISAISQFL